MLAIDGAQLLSDEVLDLLPRQADARAKGGDPFRVVLFAREELVARLIDPGMRHLRRRITMTQRLQPLSSDEIGPYLVHRLAAAGPSGLVSFSQGALERIYLASDGRARIVNVVSDRCLLILRQPPRTTGPGVERCRYSSGSESERVRQRQVHHHPLGPRSRGSGPHSLRIAYHNLAYPEILMAIGGWRHTNYGP